MSRSNKRKVGNEAPDQNQVALPPGSTELLDSTTDILTAGKVYAIKNPVEYNNDPQIVLTEDMITADVPEGFFVVKAVSPRHYVPIEYKPRTDLDTDELTGFAPTFYDDSPPGPNPRRNAFNVNAKDPLMANRARTLQNETALVGRSMAEHFGTQRPKSPGTGLASGVLGEQGPTDTVSGNSLSSSADEPSLEDEAEFTET